MLASCRHAVRCSNVESSRERPPGIVDAELLLNLFPVRDDNSFAHDSKRTTVESESELSLRGDTYPLRRSRCSDMVHNGDMRSLRKTSRGSRRGPTIHDV